MKTNNIIKAKIKRLKKKPKKRHAKKDVIVNGETSAKQVTLEHTLGHTIHTRGKNVKKNNTKVGKRKLSFVKQNWERENGEKRECRAPPFEGNATDL